MRLNIKKRSFTKDDITFVVIGKNEASNLEDVLNLKLEQSKFMSTVIVMTKVLM